MKPFDSEEIRTFLKAVDSHLTESFEVEIIGGAAASLSFELRSGTLDIDTLTSVEGLTEAIEKAREETPALRSLQKEEWRGPGPIGASSTPADAWRERRRLPAPPDP